ncbi:MAG: CRISPR-associated endoribonuclease Cas6, partial [Bacteroidetes bacterium RIFOXYB2_FULL_35_7]
MKFLLWKGKVKRKNRNNYRLYVINYLILRISKNNQNEMRLKLELQKINGTALPINYQYELSAWIYKMLHFGNAEFAEWLHTHGYSFQNKKFKLFTFSRLNFSKFKIIEDRLQLLEDKASLVISFYIDKAVQHFIEGVFRNQKFGLGDKKSNVDFLISSVECLPEPVFTGNDIFRCISPICISEPVSSGTKLSARFVSPDEKEYGQLVLNNLLNKYLAATDGTEEKRVIDLSGKPPAIQIVSEAKSKLITIKANTQQQTKVRGY